MWAISYSKKRDGPNLQRMTALNCGMQNLFKGFYTGAKTARNAAKHANIALVV